jgi:ABC-type polysaccharide/polyol phosphate transport system ATPase subunit
MGHGFTPTRGARHRSWTRRCGISRRRTEECFPKIVDFSGLQDFIDQPIRTYSTGMVMRLAFSVAINMQPDILLADEILAVGDLAFQARCLERVALEAERGLTVLFVSHDMSALARSIRALSALD